MTTNKSTVCNNAGGVRRTRDEPAALTTPAATPTWKPVPYADLVGEPLRGLERQGVHVARGEYDTAGRDDARLFGVTDLRIPDLDTPDFSMALGLRGANDKSMAISVIAGARVFGCDNLALSGGSGAVVLRKRHTSRLDLAAVVPGAIDAFLERAGTFRLDIDRMRTHALSDGRGKEILHDAFADGVLPLQLFPVVSRLYLADDAQRERFPDRTLRSLNNAFTYGVKFLRPASQHEAGLRIGRLFGRLLHRPRPEPVAVIDGIEVNN
jgi:hypothetical protein